MRRCSREPARAQWGNGCARRLVLTAGLTTLVLASCGGEGREPDPRPEPDWSPDGRWVAVDEEGSVAFVQADGPGTIVRVPGEVLRGVFPAWAPRG
jgi:hypothetical protein